MQLQTTTNTATLEKTTETPAQRLCHKLKKISVLLKVNRHQFPVVQQIITVFQTHEHHLNHHNQNQGAIRVVKANWLILYIIVF